MKKKSIWTKSYRRSYQRAYYKKHRVELRAYGRNYSQKHRVEKIAYGKAYYQKHRVEKPLVKKSCIICYKEFETKKPNKITCSDKCSSLNHSRRGQITRLKREQKNPEKKIKRKEIQKKSYAKNREKYKETAREYYAKNREKCRKANRAYCEKNRVKINEARRIWMLKNPDKIKNSIEKSKKKRKTLIAIAAQILQQTGVNL
jgi:hypothetical protein